MIDLENMERLAKKADPLPWEVDGSNNILTSRNIRTIVYAIYDRLEDEYIPSFADTTYIVAACNAVPELIQRIRELEKSEKEKNVLHWTKEAPTKSGWYFLRLKCGACARRKPVYLDVENDLYFVNRSSKSRLKTRISELIEEEAEFFGPIEEPIW